MSPKQRGSAENLINVDSIFNVSMSRTMSPMRTQGETSNQSIDLVKDSLDNRFIHMARTFVSGSGQNTAKLIVAEQENMLV